MTVASHVSPIDPKRLLQREFSAVGLKAKDAFQALPEWWEEAVAHPSGVFEVRGFVAKHFGLEIGPDGRLRQRLMPHACFKTRTGTDISEIASARAVATAVAKVVASATTTPWSGSLPSAANLRAAAIAHGNTPWVGLDDLLDACWSNGVPVVYMPSLPVTKSKMDGMVTYCGGRPVILVTKKAAAPAWMLFVLAHEMGHIAEGHLDQCEGEAIVDEKVSEEDADTDDQEKAANTYALQVLTGGQKGNIRLTRLTNAPNLADAALRYGRANGIDPGHVLLNAVKNTQINGKEPWSLGNAALRHIGEDVPTADMCREALRRNIDMGALSDDSFEFLERIGLL
jgi:hypothetical protein